MLPRPMKAILCGLVSDMRGLRKGSVQVGERMRADVVRREVANGKGVVGVVEARGQPVRRPVLVDQQRAQRLRRSRGPCSTRPTRRIRDGTRRPATDGAPRRAISQTSAEDVGDPFANVGCRCRNPWIGDGVASAVRRAAMSTRPIVVADGLRRSGRGSGAPARPAARRPRFAVVQHVAVSVAASGTRVAGPPRGGQSPSARPPSRRDRR